MILGVNCPFKQPHTLQQLSPGSLWVKYQRFDHMRDQQTALLLSELTVKEKNKEHHSRTKTRGMCGTEARLRIQLHVAKGGVIGVER